MNFVWLAIRSDFTPDAKISGHMFNFEFLWRSPWLDPPGDGEHAPRTSFDESKTLIRCFLRTSLTRWLPKGSPSHENSRDPMCHSQVIRRCIHNNFKQIICVTSSFLTISYLAIWHKQLTELRQLYNRELLKINPRANGSLNHTGSL